MASLRIVQRPLSLWARLTGAASTSALATKGSAAAQHAPPETARELYKEIMKYADNYPLGPEYYRANVRFLFHKYKDVTEPVCALGVWI